MISTAHADAMFRTAAKLLKIASWTPRSRQMGIVKEAAAMLEARAALKRRAPAD